MAFCVAVAAIGVCNPKFSAGSIRQYSGTLGFSRTHPTDIPPVVRAEAVPHWPPPLAFEPLDVRWFESRCCAILCGATGTYREVPVGESGARCIQCLGAPLAHTTVAGLIFDGALF